MFKNDPEYLLYKDTLDLDAPMKARIEKRKTKPVPKTAEELRRLVTYTKRWRDSNPNGAEFSNPGVLKPKVLNPWEMARATAPDRSLKAPPGKRSMKVPVVGREFGAPSEDLLTADYKKTLATIKEQHKEYVQYPSRFGKPPPQPSIEHPRGFRPCGTINSEFTSIAHMLPNNDSQ